MPPQVTILFEDFQTSSHRTAIGLAGVESLIAGKHAGSFAGGGSPLLGLERSAGVAGALVASRGREAEGRDGGHREREGHGWQRGVSAVVSRQRPGEDQGQLVRLTGSW